MILLNYLKLYLHDTVTLLTIINPIAAAGIMVTLIDSSNKETVRYIAKRTTLFVFFSSIVTFFAGQYIFQFFDINILSIKVIGGLIILLISINMIYGQPLKARNTKEEANEAKEKDDVAIVPLGIPILFGPAAIALLVVLNDPHSNIYQQIITLLSILTTTLTIYITLLNASAINKLLGVTGIKILTRVMGLILGAISSQLLISGIKGLWLVL